MPRLGYLYNITKDLLIHTYYIKKIVGEIKILLHK